MRGDLNARTLQLRELEVERERANKLAVKAQLALLESCLRPHFLFNTLNTISALIPDDPRLAESLIQKLAALLRLSLASRQAGFTPLEKELTIVSNYVEIERARYGGRLKFRIEVPCELMSSEVPSLAVQTLVENSVKFAVAARLDATQISVTALPEGNYARIIVADDGPGFAEDDLRPGHRIDNLRRRLVGLFGAAG